MSIKKLRNQLFAAIAMVLVASIALGSSTYAWFVTNNKVDATTSTISAQSNAAFMTIENGATGAKVSDKTTVVSVLQDSEGHTLTKVPLYPATFGEEIGSTKGQFMTGYGDKLNDGKLKGDLKLVHNPDDADNSKDGKIETAVDAEYALKEQFNISSKGQNLSNLKVESVETAADVVEEQLLKTALRVLVTNSDASKWVVYGLNSTASAYEIKLSSEDGNGEVALGNVTAGEDTLVNVYLYYEGKDANIHTMNLQQGKLAESQSVKITFTAEPDNK